ncbi:MAG: molybdopterin-guanine dinucleotide biosynthesis protein B [Gammaproteobacteria bacterium]
MALNSPAPVLGFAAFSGTGKTTLLRRLIPVLRNRGIRLGLIKHSHHAFEVDRPGKDSFVLRQAGAVQVLVASSRLTAVIDQQPQQQVTFEAFLRRFDGAGLDLILVEGFKYYPMPKIELHRPSMGHPLLSLRDPYVIAVATDAPLATEPSVPVLDLNDLAEIAGFVERWLNVGNPRACA